jgi:8-oxo-dGTP diphosphatase
MRPPQRHPWVTVDGLVLFEGKLVAVLRRNEPFRNMTALPGGFVELGETTETAVVREVEEETGLRTKVSRLVGVYSEPTRDPRGHTVSVAYALDVVGGTLTAGSDAAVVVLLDMEQLPAMAFDHAKIVADWKKG